MHRTSGWLLAVLALTGCYEHRTLEFTHEMPDPDGGVQRPDEGVPDEGVPDEGVVTRPDIAVGSCRGATTVHRLTRLDIPTPSDAGAGAAVGHNVDGVGDSCGVPDYANGVDNALIDFAAALPSLAPDNPIELQTAIDTALRCTPDNAQCGLLALDVNVVTNAAQGCAEVVFTDASGAPVSAVGTGSVGANGRVRVELATFDLTIPYPTANGPVAIPLHLRDVIVTATVSGGMVRDILIGGSLQKGEFEATVRAILPLLNTDVGFEDVGPILANLYDVELGGSCTGLSVGLTAQTASAP